jgi:DNA-binding LacI/PurR family transcriptional regulator
MSISQERHKGFLQALTDNGIAAAKAPTLFASSLQQCQAACSALLQRHKPDAFFCMSDEVAAGLYPALNAANIRIPQDCKVIAISDGNLPYFMQPTLTHLHHSGLEVGKAAAQRLIDRIKGVISETEVATKILTINIVELGSV